MVGKNPGDPAAVRDPASKYGIAGTSSEVIVRKIMSLPHPDRGTWGTFVEFMKFFEPTVRWNGRSYRFVVDVIRPEPLPCGTDLRDAADLILDHGSHYWNPFFRHWSQTAANSGVQFLTNGQSFRTLDKHNTYDVLSRAMHPADRHPTTVLLPEFFPYTEEQEAQHWWEFEQGVIVENTCNGFDEARRSTDWDRCRRIVADRHLVHERLREMRLAHYPCHNYIEEAVLQHFGGRFPLYLKPAFGRGGKNVHRVESLEQVYEIFDRSRGAAFHLQEAIEEHDSFIRCMGIGPQVLMMNYRPDEPHYLHYGVDLPSVEASTEGRLRNYVRFVNAYHRWNHNTLEAMIKDGAIHPIDYANGCPDSSFLSLHVFYPWIICALVRWCTFVVVAEVDLRIDLEQGELASVLNDPARSQEEKYEACEAMSRAYYRLEEFQDYCRSGLTGVEDAMAQFYDQNSERIIDLLIRTSDFPVSEHDRFIELYRDKMDRVFRPSVHAYLTNGVPC